MTQVFRRTASRFALTLACLAVLLGAACYRLIEPMQDARIVAALEQLSDDTDTLFADFDVLAPTTRQTRYDSLDAQAAAIIRRAQERAEAMEAGVPDGDYGIATAGFLADYTRNLRSLAAADATASSFGPMPQLVALQREAMRDALNDALFYERDVLSRMP